MRTIGEKVVATAFTFSACKKVRIQNLKKNSENVFLKDMKIYPKKQLERLGALETLQAPLRDDINNGHEISAL